MATLQVIIGSTRPGRIGLPVANWFVEHAKRSDLFDVEVVDLAEVALPLLDEPHHPRLGQYENSHTHAWSEIVKRGDAYVFVVPEYNHGMNAVTKNAIDYLNVEWSFKPVGFVSYGGISAGTRAVSMLQQVVATLNMVPVGESVNIPMVQQFLKDGTFSAIPPIEAGADEMLRSLGRWESATRVLRPGGHEE